MTDETLDLIDDVVSDFMETGVVFTPLHVIAEVTARGATVRDADAYIRQSCVYWQDFWADDVDYIWESVPVGDSSVTVWYPVDTDRATILRKAAEPYAPAQPGFFARLRRMYADFIHG